MKTINRFGVPLLLAALLVSCAPQGPQTLTDADVASIRANVEGWDKAFNARDWAGVASFYTEDCIMMAPNTPTVQGRAAVEALFAQTPPFNAAGLEITEIDGRGDLAVVHGTYSMTFTIEGMPPFEDTGKWIEVRYKQADGSWLIHRDIYNSDVAPPKEG
ncbi:MAG: SgcJ/EcaC family oxidoreductase [Bacteroidota bacterium]